MLTHAITAAATASGLVPRDDTAVVPSPTALADVSLVAVHTIHLTEADAVIDFLDRDDGCAPHLGDPGQDVYNTLMDHMRLRAAAEAGGLMDLDRAAVERFKTDWSQDLAVIQKLTFGAINNYATVLTAGVTLGALDQEQ